MSRSEANRGGMGGRTLTDREREALTGLVTVHQAPMRLFIGRFESDPSAVEELVQDVFVGVIPRCEELASRPQEDAAKYLRGVARNLVRMRWRQARRQAGRGTHTPYHLVEQHVGYEMDRDPDDSEARLNALRSCLERLPERARQLVDRHFFQGVPLARLAEEAQQSGPALRMAMLRIRRELRSCITKAHGEEAS